MEPLIAGHEGPDGRFPPPATQLDGTLRLRWVTDNRRFGCRLDETEDTTTGRENRKGAYSGLGMYFNTMLPIPVEGIRDHKKTTMLKGNS